jgi:hypothetical protein
MPMPPINVRQPQPLRPLERRLTDFFRRHQTTPPRTTPTQTTLTELLEPEPWFGQQVELAPSVLMASDTTSWQDEAMSPLTHQRLDFNM